MTLEEQLVEELRRLAGEVIAKAPQAGLIGGEWEQIDTAVRRCTMYAQWATTRPYTAPELHTFLDEVRVHHKFIVDTAKKKRRPHPERSSRRFP